jgi:hypothetical protein
MLKVGKGEYWITNVLDQDKDGNALVTKKGGNYKKVKLMVKDSSGSAESVYDLVFGSDKVLQIVNSIGDAELLNKFKKKEVDLFDLIGYSGFCVIGSRVKEGYDPQNTIEVYLRAVKEVPGEIDNFTKHFNAVKEEGDGIPF